MVDPNAPTPDLSLDPGADPASTEKVPRTPPDPEPARAALVTKWQGEVEAAREHWKDAFKQMRDDQDFARGLQWSSDPKDPRYVANITLRHIQQRVAGLYARNPRVTAKLRPRIYNTVWDGTEDQYKQAMAVTTMGLQDPQAMGIIQDYETVRQTRDMIKRVGRTLEILYQYNLDEQLHPTFKDGIKLTVRRTATTGVGYVKLGFQRVMERRPEIERQIADYSQQLGTLQRLAEDAADQRFDENDARMEQLKLLLQSLSGKEEVVVREGLTFSYPESHAILPDTNCKNLKTFLGCKWVAEAFLLSPAEVQEIYGVDISSRYTQYSSTDGRDPASGVDAANAALDNGGSNRRETRALARIYEIYNKQDGLVYEICEGWPEFLREPAPPETALERFWPWFVLTLNECDHASRIYPPSDVALMRDMQTEINRSREGLREHRRANRPKIVTAAGQLDDEDVEALKNHPANAVIELNALQPGQSVDQVLQAMKMPGIDPNLYEVNPAYTDYQRVLGFQEANLGGTSNSTATESNIAQASLSTSVASSRDDLDELLSEMARHGGQVLLMECSQETAKRIAGNGAVWPNLSRKEISEETYLGVKAGSSGKPNQAQEVQNMQALMPFLLQIPGINPEWLAQETLSRMDDTLDMQDAYKQQLPSIQAMNRMMQATQGASDPNAQAGEGAAEGAGNGAPGQPKPRANGAAPPGQTQQQMAGQVGAPAAGRA